MYLQYANIKYDYNNCKEKSLTISVITTMTVKTDNANLNLRFFGWRSVLFVKLYRRNRKYCIAKPMWTRF